MYIVNRIRRERGGVLTHLLIIHFIKVIDAQTTAATLEKLCNVMCVTKVCDVLQKFVMCYKSLSSVTKVCDVLQKFVLCYKSLSCVTKVCDVLQKFVMCYKSLSSVTKVCHV